MKTKIVYDIVSSLDDIYFEQVWASAWTLKYYNPESYILLLTDQATYETIYTDVRSNSLNIIDEIQVINFDLPYSNKEKSRWIKTNLRNLVKGDFLFIDADTIITGSLSTIDDIECSIGAVLDNHCRSSVISDYPVFIDMYSDPFERFFGVKLKSETDVFNSGVLLVKDTPEAYKFFDSWHKNWLITREKGEVRDQLSMTYTNQELNYRITEISGIYNCQIRVSVQYMFDAIIIHTFSHQNGDMISPLFGFQVYNNISKEKKITSDIAEQLLNCKRSFYSPTFLTDKRWMHLRFSPPYILLDRIIESTNIKGMLIFRIITLLSRILNRLLF